MNYYTYAHQKPDGKIFYIGKGTSTRAYSPHNRNSIWQRTVKKYGGFSVLILAGWPTEKEAFEHEIFLIDTFRGMGYALANIAAGGEGSTGFRHTEAHKTTLTERMLRTNPMGDADTRKKQRVNVKIAMQRPEVRKKQSKNRMGMAFSESHISNLKLCHPMRACVVNGVEYVSLMEASRILKIRHGTLHRWLNNPEVVHTARYAHIVECRWSNP